MVIKKLIICNFRSYYGKKEFVFSNHLNLILGSNGDGKTTFFDAINWVLTPDYIPTSEYEDLPDEASLVSAKMFAELKSGDSGPVLVSMELNNNFGSLRVVERSFNVTKGTKGEIRIDGRSHRAFQFVGGMRKELFSVRDVFEKENAFPAVIRKYHIFKGEDKLNIFNDKTTLQTLLDMFSGIKDLDPYKQFAQYAMSTSEKAISGTKDKASKQNSKALQIQKEIVALTMQLERAESELATSRKEYDEAKGHIDAIDNDYEVIQEIDTLEKKVVKLGNDISRIAGKIDEEYDIKLLDEQWILMGFSPILKDYNNKMLSFAFSKDNIEANYKKKQEEESNRERLEKAKTELSKIT